MIALFGFGTVGTGFYQALEAAGLDHLLGPIVVRDPVKERSLPQDRFSYSVQDALSAPGINLVVEATNRIDDAYQIVRDAIVAGLDVVSASKAMLARHLPELEQLAAANGVQLRYEAAVAGSIPILGILRGHYRAEQVLEIRGILNGTSNYILTRQNEGASYASALAEAQAAGYAETDPTSDVDGLDAAYKLQILTHLAFRQWLPLDQISVQGIRGIAEADLIDARAQAKRYRLIARASLTESGQVLASVRPEAISLTDPLYTIERENNAVGLSTRFAGQQLYVGRGAGGHPTGSAILADVAAILDNIQIPA